MTVKDLILVLTGMPKDAEVKVVRPDLHGLSALRGLPDNAKIIVVKPDKKGKPV